MRLDELNEEGRQIGGFVGPLLSFPPPSPLSRADSQRGARRAASAPQGTWTKHRISGRHRHAEVTER